MFFRSSLFIALFSSLWTHSSAQTFTEISASAGIDILPQTTALMGGGVVLDDFNGDGLDDIFITGCNQPSKLYQNDGDMTFTDVTNASGLGILSAYNAIGACSADIDNDGDQDLFVYTWRFSAGGDYAPNLLLRNNGDGSFADISADAGLTEAVFTMSGTFLDVNLDGYVDLYVGNYVETPGFITVDGVIVGFDHECFEDQLYLNNQDNTFTNVTATYGVGNDGCTLAVAATDYDNDGDTDLMVANDFGEFIVPNRLYRNDYPTPGFTDVGEVTGANVALYGMGIAPGDYDEDGDLDYYITNMGHNPLMMQDGGTFDDVSPEAGTGNDMTDGLKHTTWGTGFLDLDNDSYLDLVVAAGHMPTIEMLSNHPFDPNRMYHNLGDGTFVDISATCGALDTNITRGFAYGDLNHDGRLDMAFVNVKNDVFTGLNEHFLLYENTSEEANYVSLGLTGTTSNRNAIGAHVYVYAGGRVFMREINGGGDSHCSQHSRRVLVGLGSISAIDSVVVHWPGGATQILDSPAINEHHAITEGVIDHVSEQAYAHISMVYDPVQQHLTVVLPSELNGVQTLSVHDGAGRLIVERNLQPGRGHTIPLPGVSDGVYMASVRGQQGRHTTTLCVQHR